MIEATLVVNTRVCKYKSKLTLFFTVLIVERVLVALTLTQVRIHSTCNISRQNNSTTHEK